MKIEIDLDQNEIMCLGSLMAIAYTHKEQFMNSRRILQLTAKIQKAFYESLDNPDRKLI